MKEPLVIRADANPRIGTGHVMRCLALAQQWLKTGTVIFALAESTAALENRLSGEGILIRKLLAAVGSAADVRQTLALALQIKARWIVVDGYQFDFYYQKAIKDAGLKLLLFDDYGHSDHYCADLVLNQNWGASPRWYENRETNTHLLLGTRFCVLRNEFLAWRNWKRDISEIGSKVLVTLGGSDPDNVTEKVMKSLRGVDVEAKLVIGGSDPHLAELNRQLSLVGKDCTTLKLLADVKNMPELMSWADFAIAGGGTTCWELAFMGLPSLVFVLADNQAASVQRLDEIGVISSIGDPSECSLDALSRLINCFITDKLRRRVQSERGRLLVDGYGAERVIAAIQGELDPI